MRGARPKILTRTTADEAAGSIALGADKTGKTVAMPLLRRPPRPAAPSHSRIVFRSGRSAFR